MSIKVKQDKVNAILRSLQGMERKQVMIGVPSDTSDRRDPTQPITNAEIAYIQDNGSPANNIPARPFMRPGMDDAAPRAAVQMKKGITGVLDGDHAAGERALDAAGIVASSAVKNVINSGNFTPLADSTLAARAARGRAGAQEELDRRDAGHAPGTDLAKPLVDTGQLRNSITYVVRSTED